MLYRIFICSCTKQYSRLAFRLGIAASLCTLLFFPIAMKGYCDSPKSESGEPTKDPKEFKAALAELRVSDVKMKELIRQYEELLASRSAEKGTEEAMIDLAKLHDRNRDKSNLRVGNSTEKAAHWYRSAFETAPEGSQTRATAGVGLVTILQESRDEKKLAESRSTLLTLVASAENNPIQLLRLRASLVKQAIVEGNLPQAEVVCRSILDIDKKLTLLSGSNNLDAHARSLVDNIQSSQIMATTTLVRAFADQAVSRAEKEAWLSSFSSDYADREHLQHLFKWAQNRIGSKTKHYSDIRKDFNTRSESKTTSRILFLINIFVVLMLSSVLLYRRMSNRMPKSEVVS